MMVTTRDTSATILVALFLFLQNLKIIGDHDRDHNNDGKFKSEKK